METATFESLVTLMSQNCEMLQRIYVSQLFVIGVVGAVVVCMVLYKFLREFY